MQNGSRLKTFQRVSSALLQFSGWDKEREKNELNKDSQYCQ